MSVKILIGDALAQLEGLPEESVQCCVTSPPYYGLRDYGVENAIGLEATPEAHIAALVEVFRKVRRVLRKDGVLWLNYGDAYSSSPPGNKTLGVSDRSTLHGVDGLSQKYRETLANSVQQKRSSLGHGAKPKDLLMLPARVALALQADGWWLRSMLPWVKRSAMPESVTDRPATAIEYVFMLTKSGDTTFWQHRDGGGTRTRPAPDYRWIHKDTGEEVTTPPEGWNLAAEKTWRRVNLWRRRDYFWDGEAVRTEAKYPKSENAQNSTGPRATDKQRGHSRRHDGFNDRWDAMTREEQIAQGRNFRNSDLFYASLEPPHGLISGPDGAPLALDVNPAGFAEAHFATFPPKLIEPLIKAATSEKGCCAECGAPWVREVETSYTEGGPKHTGNAKALRYGRDDHATAEPYKTRHDKTLGWSPSCACGGEPVPCSVLDLFGGAGTTGLVADRLGRDAVLIELNPDYAAMARKRIAGDAPLFAEVLRQAQDEGGR